MSKRKVLITGAAGKIAGQVLPALQERYDLTLLDAVATGRTGSEVEGAHHEPVRNCPRRITHNLRTRYL